MPTTQKICVGCGLNVAGAKRFKDDQQNYYCPRCWQNKSALPAEEESAEPEEDGLADLVAARDSRPSAAPSRSPLVAARPKPVPKKSNTGGILATGGGILLVLLILGKIGLRTWDRYNRDNPKNPPVAAPSDPAEEKRIQDAQTLRDKRAREMQAAMQAKLDEIKANQQKPRTPTADSNPEPAPDSPAP